eukprot:Protomagalhaensia_wolfi_Nauph_80__1774@NODE_2103_length_1212_cov_115_052003_g1644_i0_p1_GENE_NODE_2103_length_1212_cov_115_052003_g1644_i0NODE_2103_length_1212_cov_115_052003_g1644_i0_p1_ORF_typecomplete_len259_score42_17_NODE_2103_length_1212_cov_115_052003_g1644_i03361112
MVVAPPPLPPPPPPVVVIEDMAETPPALMCDGKPPSLTSHIQMGSFSFVVKVMKPAHEAPWPEWKLHVVNSDGSSFDVDSTTATMGPEPPASLVRIVPALKRSTAEMCHQDLGSTIAESENRHTPSTRGDPLDSDPRAIRRNERAGAKGRGKVKYDIRWADPANYSEAQLRALRNAPWPFKVDPQTRLPVVWCHKCYLDNRQFEQCETTYPKGRWVYWRHFKCGASYVRGTVFPQRLVAQWSDYHVSKHSETRKSLLK